MHTPQCVPTDRIKLREKKNWENRKTNEWNKYNYNS